MIKIIALLILITLLFVVPMILFTIAYISTNKSAVNNQEPLNFKMGVIKDDEDERDFTFRSLMIDEDSLPESVDLRDKMPSVFSQNQQGSCTANAGTACIEYLEYNKNGQKNTLSRQYLYNMNRITESTPLTNDNGAQSRTICRVLINNGCAEEDTFVYGDENFSKVPPEEAHKSAQNHKISSYYRIANTEEMKLALSKGLPCLAGIEVYNSFMRTGIDGIVPKVNKNKEECIGGHEILIVGFRPVAKSKNTLHKIFKYNKPQEIEYLIRNSWGKDNKNKDSWGYAFNNPSDGGWGENNTGYGYIKESDLQEILMDSWCCVL